MVVYVIKELGDVIKNYYILFEECNYKVNENKKFIEVFLKLINEKVFWYYKLFRGVYEYIWKNW